MKIWVLGRGASLQAGMAADSGIIGILSAGHVGKKLRMEKER